MFYDDVRRLEEIHEKYLEDSSSEVYPALLLEISALTLRCTSRWIAAEYSYVWSRAHKTWTRRSPFLNFIQNLVYRSNYETDERLEVIQQVESTSEALLFRMEELLLEIVKIEQDEQTRNMLVQMKMNTLLSTPIRRTESTSNTTKARNWLVVVQYSREIVWKALNIPFKTEKKSNITQHEVTRRFVGNVLKVLNGPRPGSAYDVRSPLVTSPSNYSRAYSELEVHYPFWDNYIVRTTGYLFGLGCIGLIIRRANLLDFRWTETFASAKSWFLTHLFLPGQEIIHELFFNTIDPKNMKQESVMDAETSLKEMLVQYQIDKGLTKPISLNHVSQAYEHSITRPLREILFGDLIRLILIQVQVLKNETLQVANQINNLLRENHFNAQVLASIPAVAFFYFGFDFYRRLSYYVRDESISRASAKRELQFILYKIQTLLVQEDDGPPLFSYLTDTDRGSEAGASEQWAGGGGQHDLATKQTMFVTYVTEEDNHDDYNNGALNFDPHLQEADLNTRYRKRIAGKLICILHDLNTTLIRSKSILFRHRLELWEKMMQDVEVLFPRSGWGSHSRFRLARCLGNMINEGGL